MFVVFWHNYSLVYVKLRLDINIDMGTDVKSWCLMMNKKSLKIIYLKLDGIKLTIH